MTTSNLKKFWSFQFARWYYGAICFTKKFKIVLSILEILKQQQMKDSLILIKAKLMSLIGHVFNWKITNHSTFIRLEAPPINFYSINYQRKYVFTIIKSMISIVIYGCILVVLLLCCRKNGSLQRCNKTFFV